MLQRCLVVCALLAGAACKKDDAKPAPVAPVDKPADKPADKPPAIKPAEKAPEPPPGPAWQQYTSKDGGFTVDLPGKADESEQGALKIVGAQFGATATDARTAMCGVAHMELPSIEGGAKKILDGATARHKQGATVIEDKDVKLGKYPGRSIVVENTSHRKWMRAFLVGKTIYIVNCGGPFDRAASDGAVATRVLDSFALAK